MALQGNIGNISFKLMIQVTKSHLHHLPLESNYNVMNHGNML